MRLLDSKLVHLLVGTLQQMRYLAVQVFDVVQVGALQALRRQLSDQALSEVLLDQTAHQVTVDSVSVAHSE